MSKPKFVKITTPEFRASFVNVFVPQVFGNGKPKYNITMLILKTEDISEMKAELERVALEQWPDSNKRPKLHNPIKDGDTDIMSDGTLRSEKYPSMKGHWVITASSIKQPGIVDNTEGKLEPVMDQDQFYSGCYARAKINAYAYRPSKDNPQSKSGVAFGLLNIMKTRDGDKFGNKVTAEEDFKEFADSNNNMFSETDNNSSVF